MKPSGWNQLINDASTSFECSAEHVDRDHLFIGKSVQCEKCLDRETGAPDGRDASGRIGTEVK
jgi:hypothetical protein